MILGSNANVSAVNLTFATVIGSNAVVIASSQVQLGANGFDTVRIGTFAAPTATHLCINAKNVLAARSSSARYKENIRPFGLGRGLVNRLQPMCYNWIESKEAVLGLIAEDVAEIEPLLVTHNNKGEIQGVKYDQLTVVLINAVKEQQAQIQKQQALIERLEKRLEQLEKKDVR